MGRGAAVLLSRLKSRVSAQSIFMNFDGTVYTKKVFSDEEFISCSFENAVFEDCSFYGCSFKMCNFKNAVFKNCTFQTRFVMNDLTFAKFSDSKFRDGYLKYCMLDQTTFKDVAFDGTWAGDMMILSNPFAENVSYAMGAATEEECKSAKKNFYQNMQFAS